jgi:prepilin-type N-terminal cleavage/methylation domain-containing protein
MNQHRTIRRGFTLIELLIVVAIIAILAAIAVPNFLEAQTRSKVSRTKADMRSIATAMEAYAVDWNSYTCDSDNTIGKNNQDGLKRLTTPMAYLSSLARDVFQQQMVPNSSNAATYFELGSGADNDGWGGWVSNTGFPKVQAWLLISVGTDVNPPNQADDTSGNDQFPYTTVCINYDPTNGTISNGDIYRAGGALKTGTYVVDGVPLGDFKQ